MKLLEERIKKDGKALGKTVLKVDSFINHQVDSEFMDALGKDFAEHFKEYGITKVFTIESSGIAPALMTAKYLDVPMVILKKQTSKILNGKVYQTRVTSFTKGTSYELTLYQDYIDQNDKVATVYKGNIIKNLIMDCQSYTKYRPNETTGGIFVSWRRKEELPTGA